MVSEARTWRGQSGDERALERRRRLFAAALEIADSEGIASVTVRGVCSRADLTSRYFYESFRDSSHLLVSLYDELAEQAIATVAAGVLEPEGDFEDRIRSGVDAAVAFLFQEDRRAIRFLLVTATARPDLNDRRRALIAEVVGLGTDALLHGTHMAEVPPTIAVTARFIIGGLIESSTAFVEGHAPYSLDELIDATKDIVLSLIGEAAQAIDSASLDD